jgi:hypothetical protein
MEKMKFLLWTIFLFFGLAGCTYYMQKPPPADFSYQGNLIERDLGINQSAQ